MNTHQLAAFLVAMPFLALCFAFIAYEVAEVRVQAKRGDPCDRS